MGSKRDVLSGKGMSLARRVREKRGMVVIEVNCFRGKKEEIVKRIKKGERWRKKIG